MEPNLEPRLDTSVTRLGCRSLPEHLGALSLGGLALVVDQEVREVMPHVAVLVQVGHGRLQWGLQSGPVVLEEPQDQPPHQRREPRERVRPGLGDEALLHTQAAQGKQGAGQQVHADLWEGRTGLQVGPATGNLLPTPAHPISSLPHFPPFPSPTPPHPGALPVYWTRVLQSVGKVIWSGLQQASEYYCLCLFLLAALHGKWDLSSSTRDSTHIPCNGSTQFKPLDRQGSPTIYVF